MAEREGSDAKRHEAEPVRPELLAYVLDAISDLVALIDTEEHILLANRAFHRLLAPSRSVLVGTSLTDALPRRTYQEIWPHVKSVLAGGQVSFHVKLKLPSAGSRRMRVSLSPRLDEDHRATGFVMHLADVTEEAIAEIESTTLRRELADVREEREDMREERELFETQRRDSLGVLAGGIAHDFNNLLTVMLGDVGMALKKLPTDSGVLGNLKRMEKAALRAGELTQQLLAYAGKGRYQLEELDLGKLIHEMRSILEVTLGKNVELHLDIDPALPRINADASQMRQILMGLAANASEAIGDRPGSVTIRTVADGDAASVEVHDTGCGMDEESIRRAFEPFFTTKFTGRGLGLAAIQGIVNGHKGRIEIESRLGKGTSVRYWLPSVTPTSDKPRSRDRGSRSSGKTRGRVVLLADDEEAVRETAAEILRDSGLNVLVAADGIEALELIADRHEEIELALLDMGMPRMDGPATFREIYRRFPGVAVVMFSGFDEQGSMDDLRHDGLAGFLQKPFTPDELLAAVRAALPEPRRPARTQRTRRRSTRSRG